VEAVSARGAFGVRYDPKPAKLARNARSHPARNYGARLRKRSSPDSPSLRTEPRLYGLIGFERFLDDGAAVVPRREECWQPVGGDPRESSGHGEAATALQPASSAYFTRPIAMFAIGWLSTRPPLHMKCTATSTPRIASARCRAGGPQFGVVRDHVEIEASGPKPTVGQDDRELGSYHAFRNSGPFVQLDPMILQRPTQSIGYRLKRLTALPEGNSACRRWDALTRSSL
jgi:hypothetical protein